MNGYSSHRSEKTLLHDAALHATQERESQSKLLVDIAEIDARKIYREAGYDSIHSYCVHELRLSEKAAFHRIWVARVAWKFPCVLVALSECRLHMSAVSKLATYFTNDNSKELVELAAGKTKSEIEQLIAERFPSQDLFTAAPANGATLSSGPSAAQREKRLGDSSTAQHPPEGVELPAGPAKVLPIDERFPLAVGLKPETHAKLRHAQDLLAHAVPSGDVAEVLDRALDALIHQLEKRKFAVTNHPRGGQSGSRSARTIPAEVRRAVMERDGARCTFVAENGTRCLSRRRLEFDHVLPIARGGQSTVRNVRLLCRAHNQLMAERALGREYVNGRVEQARSKRAAAAERKAADDARALGTQLVSGLRKLGFSADESRRALADFDGDPNASAEVRMRAALAYLVPAQRCTSSTERLAIST